MPPARIALWVASIGGLSLLARALWFTPPPLWMAVAALLAYATFATLGVVFPQLEMFGDVFWRGDVDANVLALTFDDGPHPDTTRQVLAILARGGHVATFFVVGRKVLLHGDVVREIHEAGHEIALHGYAHDRLYAFKTPSYVKDDIERTQRAIEQACGVRPTLFRPPMAHVSSRTAAGVKRARVRLVGYSVRGMDGLSGANPQRVLDRVERKLARGAVVLLHDASERDDFTPASVEALPRLLDSIDGRGMTTVTLSELIARTEADA